MHIYRTLLEFLPHEVHIWKIVRDQSDQIKTWVLVEANPKALKKWGKELSQVQGKATEEIFFNADPLTTFMPIVEKIFSTKQPHKWQSYFSGTGQILEMLSIPVGEYFISVGSDATAEIKAREFINQAHRLDSLGAVAGGIIHDLNNIFGIIMNCAPALNEAPLSKQQQSYVDAINAAADTGADLTGLILSSFAKNDHIPKEEIDLNIMLKNIFKLIKSAAADKVTIDLHENLRLPKVYGNRIHIRQILFNIANNAIQAMRDRGGKLSLKAEHTDVKPEQIPDYVEYASPGSYVRVTISDTGHGIDPNHLPHIFEPFLSFDPEKGGSGLGLSIVKSLLKSHQGFITVTSQVDVGTTFYIYFPT